MNIFSFSVNTPWNWKQLVLRVTALMQPLAEIKVITMTRKLTTLPRYLPLLALCHWSERIAGLLAWYRMNCSPETQSGKNISKKITPRLSTLDFLYWGYFSPMWTFSFNFNSPMDLHNPLMLFIFSNISKFIIIILIRFNLYRKMCAETFSIIKYNITAKFIWWNVNYYFENNY